MIFIAFNLLFVVFTTFKHRPIWILHNKRICRYNFVCFSLLIFLRLVGDWALWNVLINVLFECFALYSIDFKRFWVWLILVFLHFLFLLVFALDFLHLHLFFLQFWFCQWFFFEKGTNDNTFFIQYQIPLTLSNLQHFDIHSIDIRKSLQFLKNLIIKIIPHQLIVWKPKYHAFVGFIIQTL